MHQNSDEKRRLKFLTLQTKKLQLRSQACWCRFQYPRVIRKKKKRKNIIFLYLFFPSAVITLTLTNNFHSERAKDETLVKAELGHFLFAFHRTLVCLTFSNGAWKKITTELILQVLRKDILHLCSRKMLCIYMKIFFMSGHYCIRSQRKQVVFKAK